MKSLGESFRFVCVCVSYGKREAPVCDPFCDITSNYQR